MPNLERNSARWQEQNMDDSIPDPRGGPYTEITVRIPDDLARRLGTGSEVERRVLEALALEEFKQGHLTKPELRRLLGFSTRMKLDEFLKAHDVYEPYTLMIWSASAVTCNGLASERGCGSSSPTPDRSTISC
jgi:hypothetical protein